jgi:hypothetical protein
LYESEFGIAVPVRPVELFGIDLEQSGINRRKAVPAQQPAAVATEDEPALVFTDQPRQFVYQTGDMQIGEILFPIDATITGFFLIPKLTAIGQRGLAVEVAWQISLGGRFEALLTDGVHQ